ncbi:MAG: ATP-dependent protease ATPase subunit HslU [Thermaerobacter sp.]|nr:ATP-dependent protease ATPase subunit HslU [Thermaerobacter sp.]
MPDRNFPDPTPREIVAALDRYVIGQERAKRCVAIALRNRSRRNRLDPSLRDEVLPKNILMIGPTGVGKTEIARRLAALVGAPFLKVEATKYTEVGYVGRDVESMVRDLVEVAVRMVREELLRAVQEPAAAAAQERLVDLLAPPPPRPEASNPLQAIFGGAAAPPPTEEPAYRERRERVRRQLAAGELEDRPVEVELEESLPSMLEVFSGSGAEEMGVNLQDVLGNLLPRRRRRQRVAVAEAKRLLTREEAARMINPEEVAVEAVQRAEQWGIIFIDELDKVAGRGQGAGPDVSREGVQRDILPIVEGCTVHTKYGPVRTDHMLFMAAGAFHVTSPADLIPELQGRFPIRVELESLTREDFVRILTEPGNALPRQYEALLATEGVVVRFAPDGVDRIADLACRVNEQTENIGARRLATIMEALLEELSFGAPEAAGRTVEIDAAYVDRHLEHIVEREDLRRYIL